MLSDFYKLVVTTQGPTYPPSEIMDDKGNFVVIGNINLEGKDGECKQEWGAALVAQNNPLPPFGKNFPYKIIKFFDWQNIVPNDDWVLYTLPLPLPCNNYPVIFAPEQKEF
jgi:hypothetical protein